MEDHRIRERLPLNGSGSGKVTRNGQFFYFHIVDFTTEGLLLKIDGEIPPVGEKVEIAFEVDGETDSPTEITLNGEIRHRETKEGETLCGVRIVGSNSRRDMDLFDEIYLERFFEASV
ncbi:MAG: PilZ domain-containing protein [Deltaproteobacteria bacterium]|nr:PilZ domain-containing protein [Deltaproteobacteria bacterium]